MNSVGERTPFGLVELYHPRLLKSYYYPIVTVPSTVVGSVTQGSTDLSNSPGLDVGLRGEGSMDRALLGDLQQLRPLLAA